MLDDDSAPSLKYQLATPPGFQVNDTPKGNLIPGTKYTAVWARPQETQNLGKPDVLILAPSSNNLEHK